jgi:hypothetical protein
MNNQVDQNGQPVQQPIQQPVVQAQAVQQPVMQAQPYDNRTVQAIEIGRLRNEKIGKPGLVLWIFALFAIVFVSLPIIRQQLNDPNSFLYKIVYKSNINPDDPITPIVDPDEGDKFSNAANIQVLSKDTAMKYENLILKNFTHEDKNLYAVMFSQNGILDLDEKDWYMEIYSKNKTLLGHIKLTGSFDYQEKQVELVGTKINYNPDSTYYGKITTMTDAEYPEVEYNTTINDEGQSVGSFVCTKDNTSLTYSFRNNSLISIKDIEKVELGEDQTSYTHLLSEYRKKVDAFGETYARLDETSDENFKGFVVDITVNYDDPNFKMPEVIKDYNYFDETSVAKKVSYDMTGKGFECK